jgi:hypothetical protein
MQVISRLNALFFRSVLSLFVVGSLLLQGASGHRYHFHWPDMAIFFVLLALLLLLYWYPHAQPSRQSVGRFLLLWLLPIVLVLLLRTVKDFLESAFDSVLVQAILVGAIALLCVSNLGLIYTLARFRRV